MNNTANQDINYVKDVLTQADNKGYPSIYILWGCIILAGYILADISPDYTQWYWYIATPVGIAISSYLGYRTERSRGQQDSKVGSLYMKHFCTLALFIFAAMFSREYFAILLLVAMAYCLAGIHLDKYMYWIGLMTLAAYILIKAQVVDSNTFVGASLAAGFFAMAYLQARSNEVNLSV